ncbi:MAG: hypothetical protein A4E19_09675 [Nitrospira sp. SG-bin1]|nr:MAG: hypothetical protein A4E19_09675 [Nitrospira sp. SG-bin1]
MFDLFDRSVVKPIIIGWMIVRGAPIRAEEQGASALLPSIHVRSGSFFLGFDPVSKNTSFCYKASCNAEPIRIEQIEARHKGVTMPAIIHRDASIIEPESGHPADAPHRSGHHRPIIVAILACVIALYALLGFVALPWYLQTKIPETVSAYLGKPVGISDVQLNPFTLVLTVRGFDVKEADHTTLMGFDELLVDLSLSSVMTRTWTFEHIRLQSPYARLVIDQGGHLNVRTLLRHEATTSSPAAASAEIREDHKVQDPAVPAVMIQALDVENGDIEFHDRSRTPYDNRVHVWFALKNFGSRQAQDNAFTVRAELDQGGTLVGDGRLLINPLYSEGRMTVTGVNLRDLWESIQDTVEWEVREGSLQAETAYAVEGKREGLQVKTWNGGLQVNNLTVLEKGSTGTIIAFPAFAVQGMECDLNEHRVGIRHVESSSAAVQLVIEKDGRMNLQRLLTVPTQRSLGHVRPASREQAASSAWEARIDKVVINDSRAVIEDRRTATPVRFALSKLHLDLEHVAYPGTMPLRFVASGVLNETGALTVSGDLTLDPLGSKGRLMLTGIRLRDFVKYAQGIVKWDIREGTLQAETSYVVGRKQEGLQIKTWDGALQVNNLTLFEQDGKQQLIVLPSLAVRGIGFDLRRHHVSIEHVVSHNGSVLAVIERDGRFNLQRLFATEPERSSHAVQTSFAEQAASPVWTARIDKAEIDRYRAMIEDQRPAQSVRVTLSQLDLRLAHATYPATKPVRLAASMSVDNRGALTVAGKITPAPPGADVTITASRLPLASVQPYLEEVAHVEIKEGEANVAGQVRYAAGPTSSFRFQGDASVTNLKTTHAQLKKDLVNWDTVAASSVDVRLPAGGLEIGEIMMRQPYVDVILTEDRTLNLNTVMKPRENDAGTTPEGNQPASTLSQSRVTTIDAVHIVDGSAHFADFSIHPQVDTSISRLNGSIRHLSSNDAARAEVDLRGAVEESAPVTIVGTMNPLSREAFTDLHVSFKNVNFPDLSPYAIKFAGYPIEQGKLSMDIAYRLAHQHLEAENEVIIDQLTLGEKVDSPDAISLPVKLIVALLKDQQGRINVRLPVSGDLNDPNFHYGRLLWNVAVNVFQKVVAAPFAWLGTFGGGRGEEEVNHIRFAVGSAEVPREDEHKLLTLARTLEDRPGLQLEVTGVADLVADGMALRQGKFQERLASVKQALTSETYATTASAREATDEEAIQALYLETFGELPSGLGNDQGFNVAEDLRARLLKAITVDESDLRRLAHERAMQVLNFLVNRAAVSADRISIPGTRIDGYAENDQVETTLDLTAS